jgi:choice-of-anchor C domain-containing protein
MHRRSIVGAAIALVASFAVAGSTLAFSGVSNGSFETGSFTEAPYVELLPGSTNITGWVIETGSIDWIGGYWPASDGSRSIDLNGLDAGTISQALATTVGNTYTVTFDLSGNPACAPSIKTLTVGATGASTETFTYDMSVAGTTLSDMKWDTRTYVFVATSTAASLTFTSTTAGICGPAIDNVVVTETVTPSQTQPATLSDCKDEGWLTVVDGDGNHFKNQGDCVSYVATKHRNPGSCETVAACVKAIASDGSDARTHVAKATSATGGGSRATHPTRRGTQPGDPPEQARTTGRGPKASPEHVK